MVEKEGKQRGDGGGVRELRQLLLEVGMEIGSRVEKGEKGSRKVVCLAFMAMLLAGCSPPSPPLVGPYYCSRRTRCISVSAILENLEHGKLVLECSG